MLNQVIKAYLLKRGLQVLAPKPWAEDLEVSPHKSVNKFLADHAQTLSQKSLNSLHNYGYIGHTAINRHLRGDKVLEEELDDVENHIDNIDDAMSRASLNSDIVVWRGMPFVAKHPLCRALYQANAVNYRHNNFTVVNDGNLQKLVNFTFTEPSYVSTTLNRDIKLLKVAPIALRIKIGKGHSAIYMNAIHSLAGQEGKPSIEEFRGFKDEHEILLDRGLSFKVTSIHSNKIDQVTVNLEVQ